MRLSIYFIILSIFLNGNETKLDSLELVIQEYRNGKEIDPDYFKASAELARQYRFQDRDRALAILDSAKISVDDFLPNRKAGDIFNVYGNLYFDTGQLSLALDNYYKCLSNAIETEDWGAASFSYSDIGYCFYTLGFYQITKYYYLKSYEYASRDGVINSDYPISHSCISLSLTYGHLNEIDSALYYLDLAKEIRIKNNNPRDIAQLYSYYGIIYLREVRNADKAIEYFNKAVDSFKNSERNVGLDEVMGFTYSYLAKAYLMAGEIKKSFDANRLCEERWSDNLIYRMPLVYTLDAQLYWKMDSLDKAIEIGNESLELAKQNGVIQATMEAHEVLALIYKVAEDFQNSNYHLNEYYTLRDSIASSNHIAALNSIETTIKLQDKEKERAFLATVNRIQLIAILIILILAIIIIFQIMTRIKLQRKNIEEKEEKNQQLEEANLTKDKFFSIIAHDLKNPVAAFKGSLEIMSKQYQFFDPSEVKEMVDELYSSSSQMQELLNNLLTWSRAQGGKVQYNPSQVDPCFLAESVRSITKQMSEKKFLSISIECDTEKIIADPNLLNIIILNLVSNAIKFSKEGGNILIKINQRDQDIVFEIKDEGVGMSKAETEKLFKLETSFSKKGTKNESGTGLGLIICQEFVNLHKGKIWVESEPGEGTSFFFIIPQ